MYLIIAHGDGVVDVIANCADLGLEELLLFGRKVGEGFLLGLECFLLIQEFVRVLFCLQTWSASSSRPGTRRPLPVPSGRTFLRAAICFWTSLILELIWVAAYWAG